MTLQHLRSSTANKRPDPTAMADGQIALNTAAASPGLFYKDSAGNLVKAGPVHVGSTAPNVSPASGGTAGNSTGESWLDTSGSNPLLKIWSGAAWQTVQPVASGTVVSTADTGSVTSTMIADGTIVNADVNASAAIAGTKISPDFGSQNVTTTGTVTGASLNPTSSTVPTNGVYLPAANSVAISTGGSRRLLVSNGQIQADTLFSVAMGGAGYQTIFRNGANEDNYITHGASGFTLFRNHNGSEYMRLDSSGRLGIGSSTPAVALDVAGQINSTTGFASNTFAVNTNPINTSSTGASFTRYKTTGGDFYLGTESSTGGGFFTGSTAYAACLYNAAATPLQFFTGGALRATLNSTGLGIGATPSAKLHVNTGTNENLWVGSLGGSGAGVYLASVNDSGSANTPLQIGSASDIRLAISGTEAARIDSSRRLLVGTSSWGSTARAVFSANNVDNLETYVYFNRGTAATSANSPIAFLGFFNGASTEACASISCYTDAACGSGDSPGRLVFSTTADGASSPTERMRIDTAGRLYNVSVGTNSLVIGNGGGSASANDLFRGYHSSTGGSMGSGTLCFLVEIDGDVKNTNNSYGAISDAKLKENIVDASSQWDDLKAIQVRNYNFKEETGQRTHTQIGVVAQEIELVSPGLVTEAPDRDAEGNDLGTVTKSVNYSVLYMKAVKALQEAMERIEQLEAKVAALESA